jgi:hypothetical protein
MPSAALATPLCVGQGTAEKRKKNSNTHNVWLQSLCHTDKDLFFCAVLQIYCIVTSYIDILWKKGTSDVVPLPDSKCGEEGTSHVMSPFT